MLPHITLKLIISQPVTKNWMMNYYSYFFLKCYNYIMWTFSRFPDEKTLLYTGSKNLAIIYYY